MNDKPGWVDGGRPPAPDEVTVAGAAASPASLAQALRERDRIEQSLRARVEFEKLLAELSARFINLSLDEVDSTVRFALSSIASFIDADRGSIWRVSRRSSEMWRTHVWESAEVEGGDHASHEKMPWVRSRLAAGETVHIPRVDSLPETAAADREHLEGLAVGSLLAVPMLSGDTLIGVVCFESRGPEPNWSAEVIGLFRLVGEIFVNTLERVRAQRELHASEERLRTVVSNAPLVLFALDADGCFTLSEGRGLEALGFEPGQVVGKSAFELYCDYPEIVANLKRALAGESFHATTQIQELFFETWHAPTLDQDGKVSGAIGVATNVTERVRAEAAHRDSDERYTLAVRGANDGLWDWDTRADTIYFSSRWKSMLGLGEDQIGTSPSEWFDRVHPDDVTRVRAGLDRHLRGDSPEFEEEYRILHEAGDWRWVLSRGIAVRDADGEAYRIAGSQSDMTKRKAVEERLLHEALHDALTGLPNRTLFVQRLRAAIDTTRDGTSFAVLFLDLDRFKLVNYGLGHVVGDQLIIEVSRRLSGCLRPGDVVARIGGDEFTVLLENLPANPDIEGVCDRFQAAMHDVHELGGHELFTSASIGVAVGDRSYSSPEEVLRDADTAMFHAKESGRGRHVVYDRRMQERAVAQLRLENDLQRAVERSEFRIDYQPIVALDTGDISGFEALIRWHHPTRGLIPPEEFISVAEDTGLIIPIGRWTLNQACRQTRVWQKRFPDLPLGISVNVSSREFSRPDLIDVITGVLRSTGLAPQALRLEITETLIMENADSVLAMLIELKRIGVQLSIDDFGTGYSSLSRLHRFPIDSFKIDRSFVMRMGRDDENPEIVRTIVTLARNLGMGVIAEGVETEAQVRYLRDLGCGWGQGYYFSKPRDRDVTTELLLDHTTDSGSFPILARAARPHED